MAGKYRSTKRYGAEIGLSCGFRQWRADSHCRLVHGYALAFKFTFESEELDVRNWVVDFGSLKGLKGLLEDTFDHKVIVAKDDPEIDWFLDAQNRGIMEVVVAEKTGCEAFAKLAYEAALEWLKWNGYVPRCRVVSVEVSEHGANSAIYMEEE